MTELKQESNVTCPHCGRINTLKIPKDQWLMWTTCQGCNKAIWGHKNPHGWDWIFCTFGDVPWLHIQEKMANEWRFLDDVFQKILVKDWQ